MIYLFMLLVIVATIFLCFFYLETNDKETRAHVFALIVILQLCNITLVFAASMQPKAIDVYRGKTTLKFEYVDGIARDSVVVYKEKVQSKSK